jgi:glutamine amidotransferase
MNIKILKYNAGNIQSVLNALERLHIAAEVTDDAEAIQSADQVIFPGVGEASSAMKSLQEKNLDAVIRDLKQPVLGICVGMQLLCTSSEENETTCLGIIPVSVKKFAAGDNKLKIPQVGWNQIFNLRSALFQNIEEGVIYIMCIVIMLRKVSLQ